MAIEIKIGVFAAASAFVMLSFAMPYLPVPAVGHGPGNIIEFNTVFNAESTGEAKKIITDFTRKADPDKRLLIKLMSPGGEVFSGKDMQAVVKGSNNIDTYVSSIAASMGADTFMLGSRRYVDEDALVLFHGAHGGNFMMSQPVLTKLIEIVEQVQKNTGGEVNISQPSKPKTSTKDKTTDKIKTSAYDKALTTVIKKDIALTDVQPLAQRVMQMVEQQGFAVVLHDLRSIRDMLKGVNETMVGRISAKLTPTKPEYTPDKVRKDLFNNFEQDMVFTGKQLVDMGIATAAGAPPEKDYS